MKLTEKQIARHKEIIVTLDGLGKVTKQASLDALLKDAYDTGFEAGYSKAADERAEDEAGEDL